VFGKGFREEKNWEIKGNGRGVTGFTIGGGGGIVEFFRNEKKKTPKKGEVTSRLRLPSSAGGEMGAESHRWGNGVKTKNGMRGG